MQILQDRSRSSPRPRPLPRQGLGPSVREPYPDRFPTGLEDDA